jgi:nicotinamidase-related amidase
MLPTLAAEAKDLAATLGRLLTAARAAGVPVLHATFEGFHPGTGPGVAPLWRATGASREWYPGHPATRVIPELFDDRDLVVPRRHGLSPTRGTDLLPVLRGLGVRTVVLAGVSLNVALPVTAADLGQDGFRVILVRDGAVGTPAEYAEQVVRHTMAMLADITTVDDVVAAWTGTAVRA